MDSLTVKVILISKSFISFSGHDTTASALSWILYSLAEHQEYQKKCQDEIDEILRGRDTDDLEW